MEARGNGVYVDRTGRTLEDYKRPSVAVDTALLTVEPGSGSLSVLLVFRTPEEGDGTGDGWSLPGTFLHEGETCIDAVQRSLREKAGIEGVSPAQLHLFDAPGRDSRGWVLSAAHLDVVPACRLAGRDLQRTRLVPLARPDGPADVGQEIVRAQFGDLPFEHGEIIAKAVKRVRDEYTSVPDPYRLLPEPFTILQLRRLHEAVAGRPLQRDTFRRLMAPQLEELKDDKDMGARGRPASRFRHKPGTR
jgi:8-oxo-dGTP diphosphatase